MYIYILTSSFWSQYFYQLLWVDVLAVYTSIGSAINLIHHPSQKNVPPCYVNLTLQVTTGGRSSSPDNRIQTKPLSIPNCTNKLDSAVNVDDNSQYFSTPRNNHSLT